MARATSGSPIVNLGGLGFWLAMLAIFVLPDFLLKRLARKPVEVDDDDFIELIVDFIDVLVDNADRGNGAVDE